MTDLTLTPNARHTIASRAAAFADPPRAGLRISAAPGTPGRLLVAMAEAPHDGDATLQHGAARLFLPPDAGRQIEGGLLDARRDTQGRIEFVVHHRRDPAR